MPLWSVHVLTDALLVLTDAVLLRILPGLETDGWLTAMGVAVVLQVGTWPIAFLSGLIDLTSPWLFLGAATVVYAVILTIATILVSRLRSQSAVAVPVAAALIAGVNYYVIPAAVVQVAAVWSSHRL